MENKIDFSVCEFINENLSFYTYYDFCDNRKVIKKLFKNLNRNGKLFYMWYVYANIHMNETFKNAIWDYLNEYDDGSRLLELKKIYRAK